jgi:hypothetical protein
MSNIPMLTPDGGILKQYGKRQTWDILLLGDSHALMWAPVIDEICQECRYTVLYYAAGAADPLPSISPRSARRERVHARRVDDL